MVFPLQLAGNDPMTLGYELVSSPLGTRIKWRSVIHGYYYHKLLKGVHTLLFRWHTLWQLGKDFNNQYKQQIPCTKISFNIPSNINKQTTNNIMQDHAKQMYIFGHISLIWSLALNISNGVATMRDLEKSSPQKRDLGTF